MAVATEWRAGRAMIRRMTWKGMTMQKRGWRPGFSRKDVRQRKNLARLLIRSIGTRPGSTRNCDWLIDVRFMGRRKTRGRAGLPLRDSMLLPGGN